MPQGFSFGASGSPTVNAVPTVPVTPAPQMNGFQQILMQMLSGEMGSGGGGLKPQDIAGLLGNIRNDPQGDANKAYIPGANNDANPFANGFFKTPEQRQRVEQNHLGMPGFSSMAAPQQQQALGTHPFQNPGEQAAGASPLPFQLSPDTLALMGHTQAPAPTTAMNMFGINSPDSKHNIMANIFRQYTPKTPLVNGYRP